MSWAGLAKLTSTLQLVTFWAGTFMYHLHFKVIHNLSFFQNNKRRKMLTIHSHLTSVFVMINQSLLSLIHHNNKSISGSKCSLFNRICFTVSWRFCAFKTLQNDTLHAHRIACFVRGLSRKRSLFTPLPHQATSPFILEFENRGKSIRDSSTTLWYPA